MLALAFTLAAAAALAWFAVSLLRVTAREREALERERDAWKAYADRERALRTAAERKWLAKRAAYRTLCRTVVQLREQIREDAQEKARWKRSN